MKLRTIIYSILLGISTLVADASDLTAKADSAYMNDQFAEAARLYLEAAEQEGTSSDLYYNIGNSYYRQNKLGEAILYYERAIRLDPLNKDARTNLEFVNTRICLLYPSPSPRDRTRSRMPSSA